MSYTLYQGTRIGLALKEALEEMEVSLVTLISLCFNPYLLLNKKKSFLTAVFILVSQATKGRNVKI